MKFAAKYVWFLIFLLCFLSHGRHGYGQELSKGSLIQDKSLEKFQASSSMLLKDGKRLERRTRDYGKHFGVSVDAFSILKPKLTFSKEMFQGVEVVSIVSGDFHDVWAHFNRMAIFAMIQKPLSLEIVRKQITNPAPQGYWKNRQRVPAVGGQVQLKSRILYFRQNPKFDRKAQSSSPLRQRQALEEGIEALRQQKENGFLSALMTYYLDLSASALTESREALFLQALTWDRERGLSISFPEHERPKLKALREVSQKNPLLEFGEFEATAQALPSLHININRKFLEKKGGHYGGLQYADAYSPLGRLNPFLWPHEISLASYLGIDAEGHQGSLEILKFVLLEELRLTQAYRGLFGLGRRAEFILPTQEPVSVGFDVAVSRYQGKVSAIEDNRVTIVEYYLNAFRKVVSRESVLQLNTKAKLAKRLKSKN